jgi:hypothetical protein
VPRDLARGHQDDCREGPPFFREGFRAHGTVWLPGATITGYLEFDGATIDGKGSAALFFDSSEIGGAVFLRHGFRATGEVRLIGTRIGGNFECTRRVVRERRGHRAHGRHGHDRGECLPQREVQVGRDG